MLLLHPTLGTDLNQDHVLFTISYEVNLITHSKLQDPVFAASQVANYITNRTGILTNTAADFLGWEKLPKDLREGLSNYTRSSLDKLPADWPELELIFPDGYSGYKTDYLTNAPADGRNYASVSIGLLAPFSRGNLSINTSDTSYNPVVNPNFLGDVRDQEFAVQAFKRARQIAQTESLQSIIIGEETFPGPSVSTDEEILTFLKKSSNTIYHASASNAMGKSTDPDAVVDSEARVIGVNSLRVVDSSVFPFIPPGHPQSAVCELFFFIPVIISK